MGRCVAEFAIRRDRNPIGLRPERHPNLLKRRVSLKIENDGIVGRQRISEWVERGEAQPVKPAGILSRIEIRQKDVAGNPGLSSGQDGAGTLARRDKLKLPRAQIVDANRTANIDGVGQDKGMQIGINCHPTGSCDDIRWGLYQLPLSGDIDLLQCDGVDDCNPSRA
jgi:hypothetical protein